MMKKLYKHITSKLLLLLLLLCGMGQAWGQTQVTWSGTVGTTTFSSNTVVTVTGDVTLTGSIKVTAGTVTIQTDGNNRMISRQYASGKTFTMFAQTGGTLRLEGNGATLTIDGAAHFATAFDGSSNMTNSGYYNGNMINTYDGHLYIDDVILQNGYNSDGPGAIRVGTSSVNNGPYNFQATNVVIRGFRGRQGAAMTFVSSAGDDSGNQNAVLTNVEIYGCYSTGKDPAEGSSTPENYGGVIRSGGNKCRSTVVFDNCYIHDNKSKYRGGGFYWHTAGAGASLTLRNNTRVCNNRANTYSGGGMYVEAGTVIIDGSKIYGNYTKTIGGGINYIDNGTSLTITNSEIYNNTSTTYGGGVHVSSGTITISNSKFYSNSGTYGGGICVDGGTVTVSGSDIYSNTCTVQAGGGGMHIGGGTVTLTGNTNIHNNTNTHSTGRGGGIYLSGSCTLNLQGVNIYENTAHNGAGVYLLQNSTLNFLECSITNNQATGNDLGGGVHLATSHTYNVNVGAAGSGPVVIKNNSGKDENGNARTVDLYLQKIESGTTTGVITVVGPYFNPQGMGIYTDSDNNNAANIKVFKSSTASYLADLYTALDNGLVEFYPNRTNYRVKEYSSSDPSYIYFTTAAAPSPWSALQQTVTSSDLRLVNGVYEISNVKELTAFLWYVNDIDTHANLDGGTSTHPSASAKLTANIDMSDHYWVPIGTNYTGTFDGNGYYISNLTMKGNNPSTGCGLFGSTASGAVIKNVQLHNCKFASRNATYMGLVASQANGGTISNCCVDGALVSLYNPATMGGLVGKVSAGEVHSSYANPTFDGGATAGGLVGELTSGANLKNSFVNPPPSGTITACDGTVTNRYVPVYGYYAECNNKTEFIIPASDLADLSGKVLSSMTFYLSASASSSWGAAGYQVFLKEVSGTTLNGFQGPSGATVVYEGSLDGTGSTMSFRFFKPFSYNGGNLLVGFYETTKGSWSDSYFYGYTTTGTTAIHGLADSSGSLDDITTPSESMSFLPKVTFGYNEVELATNATNNYVPVYGTWAEQYNKTEFIIPASYIPVASGTTLNSMTFHLSSPASSAWGSAVYQVFMKEVSATTLSTFQGPSGATVVYQGSLDGTGTTMTVNFPAPYTYNGGNLFVGFYETTNSGGDWSTATFKGYTSSGTTAIHGKSATSLDDITTSSDNLSFIPKVTFNSVALGGLVGNNNGAVQNCYMLNGTTFTGTGNGSVNYCYMGTGSSSGTNGTYSAVVKPYTYALVDNQVTASNAYVPSGTNKSLVQTLNNWVGNSNTYSPWVRTTTTTINGDYPVLKMNDFEAVAGGGATLYYGMANNNGLANNMITTHTAASEAVCVYKSTANVASNSSSDAALFIDENAAITQAGAITANVGITLKNTQNSNTSWDWHMFSPTLSNAPLGLDYTVSGTNQNVNNTAYQYGYMVDPPHYAHTGNGYFPTVADNYYGDWDYYCYYEPEYHWINFKRNGPSHWHEDNPHNHIDYVGDAVNVNENTLKPGKGYLLATKRETMLQAEGTLNNANVSIAVTTDGPYRTGYNLIGNPYQSYYDFNAFASDNVSLWGSLSNASYILLSGDTYTAYAYNASNNTQMAPRWLHPHQGFMIIASNSGTASFYNTKRITSGQSSFRGDEQPDYALVNLIATDDEGKRDITTVELGRPDRGGAIKAYDLHLGKGIVYTHYENEDYAIAFTQPGIEWVGVWFEADEEGTFTMTWDTENGDFNYLHLIDNMTGVDTDCLTASEYTFTATPEDYKSRFKLVFGYTGLEEEEEEALETFAYYADGEIHFVETFPETSQIQIIDMLGRVVLSREGVSTVSTDGIVPGVYVLRLTGANGTKTQKIVIGQ